MKSHPERVREYRRRATLRGHGVTLEQYDAMWEEQLGKCANPGCDSTAPMRMDDYHNGLHVDHDHATLKVRGLLCGPCNKALGCVNDDPKRLAGLIDYLASPSLLLLN